MPGGDVYRAIVFRLLEISRGTIGELWRQIRVAPELSIDPSNLVRQFLLGLFLRAPAEPKINAHATVFFVDDALTIATDPDTWRTSARKSRRLDKRQSTEYDTFHIRSKTTR